MGFFDKVLKVAGGAMDVGGEVLKGAGKVAGGVVDGMGSVARGAGNVAGHTIAVAGEYLFSAGASTINGAKYLKDGTVATIDIATDTLIPNKKFMKDEIEAVKKAGNRYNHQVTSTQKNALALHEVRTGSGRRITKSVEVYINSLANTPKNLNKAVSEYKAEYVSFDYTIEKIAKKVDEVNDSFKSVGGGGTLAGVGVAAFAPSAAMAFATTFGTASTGAAISSLSGAAANSAALAWLGNGAVVAGGGGMVAGNSLLAMAGPIGWTIGGLALIGSGYMMNQKCLENANGAMEARKTIENHAAKLKTTNAKISGHIDLTSKHIMGIKDLLKMLKQNAPPDYRNFTNDQKLQIGSLVNHITALSGLLNQRIE